MVAVKKKRGKRVRGRGILSKLGSVASSIINKGIDLLPVEAHLPNYNFCGPGTKLDKRLKRGDKGINRLDKACKSHDIAYAQSSDNKTRAAADRQLADKAWEIFKDSNTGLSEKAYSYLVTNLIKAKAAFGGGLRKKKKKQVRGIRKRHSDIIRQKAINQLKKHISGRGFYLKPYPSGGRILVPPTLPPRYAMSLFPKVKKKCKRQKRRKKQK